MKRMILVFLMLCGVCLGLVPICEYNSSDSALQCMRNSAAVKEDYVNGFSDLASFEKNTTPVVLSSVVEPTISAENQTSLTRGIDTYNDRILSKTSAGVLSHTIDVLTFTPIVDFSSVATPSGNTIATFWASLTTPAIYSVVMTSKTSAMVSIGDTTNSHDPSGRVYYTDDNFATFTQKLSISNGILWLTKHDSKDWWLAPTYQVEAGGALDAQTIYLSEDGGDNWVVIDTTTYGAITDNAHSHTARFYGDNTVFVTYGDGIYSRITKLTRPVEWNGTDVWTVAWEKTLGTTQISGFTIVGDKLYLRRESVGYNGSDLYIYDVTNDTFEGNTFLTMTPDADAGKPYLSKAYGMGNGVKLQGSFYVTNNHKFGADIDSGGLLVSADGKNWTTIYRNAKGVRRIIGFIGNKIVVNIFNDAGVEKFGLFDIPTVRTIDAVKVEKGQTNLIGLWDGTADDNWLTGAASRDSAIEAYSDSDRLYDQETGIKITADDNGYANAGQWILQAQDSTTVNRLAGGDPGDKPMRILSPQDTDYCTLSYDIKYEGYNEIAVANRAHIKTQTFIAGVGGAAEVHTYPIDNGWSRVYITWLTLTSDTDSRPLQIVSICDGTYAYNDDVVVKIQNVQYSFDTERVDLRSYIPKATPRADDYSIAPLTGLGSSWSVTFDWLPLNGNLCFPEVGANTTVPIATIQGATGYIELYWDRTAYDGAGGGMAFKLTDGTHTVSLDAEQAEAMQWLHNDILKFGITSDGTTTVLYCFNPENKEVHAAAILSKSGGSVIDIPTQIDLGANEDHSVIGTGAFANIRGFDSVLSAGDIAIVFDSVNNLIPVTRRMLRGMLRGRYNGIGRYK